LFFRIGNWFRFVTGCHFLNQACFGNSQPALPGNNRLISLVLVAIFEFKLVLATRGHYLAASRPPIDH
jgi:hypothetical protein